MCGLCGFWESTGSPSEQMAATVKAMTDRIVHRGPDEDGHWVDPGPGIALGFRRLAILDLTATGHQPMVSANGQFVMTMNGEVYNFPELRKELESAGIHFRGTSDTEIVLEGFAHWGREETLKKLAGMFAIALWDRKDRRLLLARDRIGKKPLYYSIPRDGLFLFGSELKSFHAHCGMRTTIDRNALQLYLRLGYIPAPWTIFQNTYKLRPGEYMLVENARPIRQSLYWNIRDVADPARRISEAPNDTILVDELESRLLEAVRCRMVSDVPLGAFLSGGIDSSLVVSLMQHLSDRPVKTFSIGFKEQGFDEAPFAREVAAHIGTDHTEFYVSPQDSMDIIPLLPQLYDEPFADSSQIPTFLVSRLARSEVTVALSGDGGDELFSGYTRYFLARSIWNRISFLPPIMRSGLAGLVHSFGARNWDRAYRTMAWALPTSLRMSLPGDKMLKLSKVLSSASSDDVYRHLVSLWKHPSEITAEGTEPACAISDPELQRQIPDFTERMMLLDFLLYLPDDILVKVDRASMGISLEARAPLLDHRLVEWVWTLPLSVKRRGGIGKWLLRQVLYRYIPRSLLERPKAGFGLPLDDWLRGPLRDWAEALLDEKELLRENYFQAAPVRQAWARHLSGNGNEQYRLWPILMFQSWLARWRSEIK